MTVSTQQFQSSGGRLVSVDGRQLPLRSVALSAAAKGGLARVKLTQRFVNPYDEPLAVRYSLALPSDAAVSGFAFTLAGQRIVGEVDKKAAARERFERALVEGRTASLLEQERSSLFTQEVGNIPPREEVTCEVLLDQRLAWITEGAWEWRFPTVVAPRYLGAEGRVPDAGKVSVEVADRPMAIAFAASLDVRDALPENARIESPSHSISRRIQAGAMRITLVDDPPPALDRDLVFRWQVAQAQPGLSLDVGRAEKGALSENAFGLLTLVPPSTRPGQPVRRDLIVLLDTSGSMGGEPLEQARRVTSALIDTLSDDDRLELIEFSNAPRRWKGKAVEANASNKKSALKWLAGLQASGGTEMRTGIIEALSTLDPEAQRQVILVTDGLIGFEQEVVREISEKCPAGSRVHTVGIGSSVNRSLTGPAARAGRGAEVVIALGEDPERSAKRLVARTDAPVVVDLRLSGSALLEHAPARIPDLFAASPALVALRLNPLGGTLVVHGRTADGDWEERLAVQPVGLGHGSPAVAALFGREKVEDLELKVAGEGRSVGVDGQIETLGLLHQIATRLTSWVAISAEATVDPTAPTRRETMPQALPHGMSAAGLGLRQASVAPGAMPMKSLASGAPPPPPMMKRKAQAPTGRTKGGADAPADADAKESYRFEERSRIQSEAEEGAAFDELDGSPAAASPGPIGAGGNAPTTPAPAPEPERQDKAKSEAPKPTGAVGRRRPPAEISSSGAGADDELELEPDEGAPPPAQASAPLAQAPAKLAGRVVLRTKDALVIEVALTAALSWDPGKPVSLVFANGRVAVLQVDLTRSTRGGQLEAGWVLRITLRVDSSTPTEAPVTAMIETTPGPFVVTLS